MTVGEVSLGDIGTCNQDLPCSLQNASSKIMQFAQHGPRAMCVLSANGAVSNVTLRQESSSGGTVTYEVEEANSQSIDMIILSLQ